MSIDQIATCLLRETQDAKLYEQSWPAQKGWSRTIEFLGDRNSWDIRRYTCTIIDCWDKHGFKYNTQESIERTANEILTGRNINEILVVPDNEKQRIWIFSLAPH